MKRFMFSILSFAVRAKSFASSLMLEMTHSRASRPWNIRLKNVNLVWIYDNFLSSHAPANDHKERKFRGGIVTIFIQIILCNKMFKFNQSAIGALPCLHYLSNFQRQHLQGNLSWVHLWCWLLLPAVVVY